ncbi:MAG: peptidoglycan D,D-transpeptidase FtsI family protein [Halochromatium sp.]|uniref:peptidoglycan D,D-transpeptidase FtsI family protein n=1 Tax=Halochromatium sp. TaxID=2049430 RepID=UPI00397C1F09
MLAPAMDLLNDLFRSPSWEAMRVGLHLAFGLALLFWLWQALRLRAAVPLRHLARPRAWLRPAVALLMLALLAILVYQATWQLGGTARPRFIAFMQSHDRRQFNPAHWIQRGRILDRRGRVLAESRNRAGAAERVYPYGPAFAHVVGYADARFGLSGIEASANRALNGATLRSLGDWGELGRQVLTQSKRPRGQDLVTTLDAELQQLAVERIAAAKPFGRGAVAMLRPADGAVLVLASVPSFDPNRLQPDLFTGAEATNLLLNRATQGQYPPGSAFKVVLAAQALEMGFKGRLSCPAEGYTTSDRYRPIRDHEYYEARRAGRTWAGHGPLDLSAALAKSSNVFFAQLAILGGHQAFASTGQRFHFNRSIAFVGGAPQLQAARLEPIPERDRYGLAQAAIGQGRVTATPAYMALVAAAIANDGIALRPRLLRDSAPEALARFMSAESARRLRAMLRRAVSEGTARGIDSAGLEIAGKTGTAENPQGASHSWFIGFAPASAPRLAVAVLVEHGGYGSTVAAPIARDLLLKAAEQGL